MMTFLPTESVIFRVVEKQTKNKIGETTTVFKDYSVNGCLVQPGSANDLGEGFELLQDRLVTVHVPTEFSENLIAGKVVVRGQEYNIISSPLALTSSPLPWNRSVIGQRTD